MAITLESILAANTAYEEAIIAAFNGSCDEALSHHNQSMDLAASALQRLRDIDAAYAMLLEDVAIERYPGNPLAPQLDSATALEELAGKVILDVNTGLFKEVAEVMRRENLVSTFKWERSLFAKAAQLFEPYQLALHMSLDHLKANAGDPRKWVKIVDVGGVLIRSTYLSLLTGFLGMFQRFVYSTALSTDLFHRTEGYGSLAREGAALRH